MDRLFFVTGNKGKILRAQEQFNENGIDIEWFNHDSIEPDINDIEYISKHKAMEAYNLIGNPCFVVDSGFYIDNYPGEPGFPGAFPKRAIINHDGKQDGISLLLEKMKNIEDRKCKFIDCLTYYDGTDFKTFYGVSEGVLSREKRGTPQLKAKSDLWYVFVPIGYEKTLAEMTDEERNNRNDNRTSAILEFIKWHKINILKSNELKEYNNLNSNMLSIGQKLLIPQTENYETYTVKSGDSLYKIASEFNTTVDKLKTVNNLTSNLLSIGQILIIPNE